MGSQLPAPDRRLLDRDPALVASRPSMTARLGVVAGRRAVAPNPKRHRPVKRPATASAHLALDVLRPTSISTLATVALAKRAWRDRLSAAVRLSTDRVRPGRPAESDR